MSEPFNDNVEGAQRLVHLSDCQKCPAYIVLDSQSPFGKRGFKGRCILNRSEERSLPGGLVDLKRVPCMDMELCNTRNEEHANQ